MIIKDIRLVATVQTRNYHGYIESFNTLYFLQVKTETPGKWQTMDIVKLEDLPPDEKLELDYACAHMASSILKKNAAK